MRLQYAVVVAAAALAASSEGLQVLPNSAKSTSLRASAEARYPPFVEGKGDRFLVSEGNQEWSTQTQKGYEFSPLQEQDDVLQQNDDEYEDDSDSSSHSESGFDDEARLFGRKKKKKKKKKHEATETPTPTPTATPEGMTATPTPAPTTEEPSGWRKFLAWYRRQTAD
uniref:Avh109 n=1 Tax=Phytophthora sojae TaxID=67593 RepID=G1FRE0_PHYSO|nr:Avh109 [Phytophthora sojae]